MPTITSASSGSGIDVRNLVDQLVAAEAGPVTSRLDRKEVDIQQGLTAIGTFKGALLDFQASLAPLRKDDAFKSINALSSNEEKFTVSAEEKAVISSYSVEISQLAESQKLKSLAFESEFDDIGTGTISIEFGTVNTTNNSFDVNTKSPLQRIDIDEENSSLLGIQQTINQAGVGVRASIINDGTGYRLILNSEKSGLENSLRIAVSDDDVNDTDRFGLSVLAYNPVSITGGEGNTASGKNLEESTQAKNALFSIDGINISASQNEIKNTIPGVTLLLKKLTGENAEKFSIEKDVSTVKKSIESFVDNYNELITTVATLTGYDPEARAAGPLSGDTSIRGIVEQIRRRLSTSFNGINENLSSLSTIGIDSSRDGSLTLDQSKLGQALENHVGEIAHLFSAATSTSDPKIQVLSKITPTVNGVFNIRIDQTAKNGHITGNFSNRYPLTLSDTTEKMVLSVDNISTNSIKLPPRRYQSGHELAAELQQAINLDKAIKRNDISVTVKYVNNALKISSNSLGEASSVAISVIDKNLSAMTGLFIGQGETGTNAKGNINGSNVIGNGNKLELEGELKGIVLNVDGKQLGARGELVVTNGVAAILNEVTNSFLSSKGLIDVRIDGYHSKISNIDKQREDLVRKLEVSEQRYLKQFSSLDAMLGKMRSTSSFLAQKLSTLPGARR